VISTRLDFIKACDYHFFWVIVINVVIEIPYMANRQIPPALTQTWVFINYADRIRFETTQPVRMMDRDLVLWKSRSGHISLQDAYCPHLGAHLGYGKVRGENLECLFHKRQFNHAGVCLGMGKNLRNYTLTVSNNMIFAWFGETQPTW
jgi:3-ketosteroid 9alpha-monooxygenase subunit A